MIYPDFIIETPSGVRHIEDKDKGVVWLLQFPEDKLVGSEWTPFAWPGGYEIHYYTKDGGRAMLPVCQREPGPDPGR